MSENLTESILTVIFVSHLREQIFAWEVKQVGGCGTRGDAICLIASVWLTRCTPHRFLRKFPSDHAYSIEALKL